MRARALLVGALVGIAGCGGSGQRPTSGAERAALNHLKLVIHNAAVAPTPGPAFRIKRSAVSGLHGLDLWSAIVDPMIAPLTPLDGTPQLRAKLSAPQYAVYVLFAVDVDYADGGMFEVYYNSSGQFASQAVQLLRDVGAPLHARALAQLNRATWPLGVPANENARRRVLGPPDRPLIKVPDSAWDEAEQREGALESIVERYIRSHPDAFFY